MRRSISIAFVAACGCACAAALAGPVKLDVPGRSFRYSTAAHSLRYTALGTYGATQTFMAAGKRFVVTTDPLRPADINTVAGDFKTKLEGEYSDWTFTYQNAAGDKPLSNDSLVVRSYDVQHTNPVECDFWLQYVPHRGDPPADPNLAWDANGSLHWIQVIKTNWGVGDPLYDTVYKVDNKSSDVPYYDDPNVTNPLLAGYQDQTDYRNSFFLADDPHHQPPTDLRNYDSNKPDNGKLYFLAETFLAVQTGNKRATIYDGVQWGYSVTAAPAPELSSVFSMGLLLGGAAFAVRSRRRLD